MREPREQLVLDILRGNWDNTNTFGLTPKISYGWFEGVDQPQVTIQQPSEGPINGGNTGYSAIDGSDGTLHQDISGSVDLHIWCAFDELDSTSATHPRQYITGDADRTDGSVNLGVLGEIERIVRENAYNPTNPETNNNPVWSMAPGDGNQAPEPDEQGLFHYIKPVQFVYNTGDTA
jgi:hypothetical protein